MSIRLTAELDDVAAWWGPLNLTRTEALLLRIIAESAHHEDDPAHEGGARRRAGNATVGPRECFLLQDRIAQQMACSPGTVSKACQRLKDRGLSVRVGKAGPGRAMVYRLPTVSAFARATENAVQAETNHQLSTSSTSSTSGVSPMTPIGYHP